MDYLNAFRQTELSEKEMQDRTCTCPENPNADKWGDNSWLPCMSPANGVFGPELHCNNCIYCQIKN